MSNLEQPLTGLNLKDKEGPMIENNCYQCQHRREVLGNAHIECVKPDATMTGSPHGIRSGWFMYPMLFDPVWMTSKCNNFESVNRACKSNSNSE